MELYLSGCRLKDGEYLILVSPEFCEKPHEQYRKRWGIETLFGALKSRGFNLEDTHLKDAERLSRLLDLLALAFTWAFVVGLWQASVKELKLKKHEPSVSQRNCCAYSVPAKRRLTVHPQPMGRRRMTSQMRPLQLIDRQHSPANVFYKRFTLAQRGEAYAGAWRERDLLLSV